MTYNIYKNLEFFCPHIFEHTVEMHERGPFELLVELDDGKRALYNDFDKSCRMLPDDPNDIDERQMRYEFRMRMRAVMQRKGITQRELSERTGIPENTLSNYMAGNTTPSFFKVDKIAKALGCSTDELRYF